MDHKDNIFLISVNQRHIRMSKIFINGLFSKPTYIRSKFCTESKNVTHLSLKLFFFCKVGIVVYTTQSDNFCLKCISKINVRLI